MKKFFKSLKYLRWHRTRQLKAERNRRRRREKNRNLITSDAKLENARYAVKAPVFAPSDLRLIDNLEGCLGFIRDLRSDDYLSVVAGLKYVIMSLKFVEQIDYAAISVLTSLNDDLKYKAVILKTILPDNVECKKFMIESGYLNNLVNDRGRRFRQTKRSDFIFFEKGTGYLSDRDSERISQIVKNVVEHITGVPQYCPPLKTIILEICGNSIEWSGTDNRQWLLGVKYESEKVIFTVTDVGRGILDTLYRQFTRKFFDLFKSDDEVLKGAFDKKYGSATKEENRNKGLPAVKNSFLEGKIKGLKVVTNNVILHFDDEQLSRQFEAGRARFRGTFYQWELTKDCLISLNSRNEKN